jgi:hypothetical protein
VGDDSGGGGGGVRAAVLVLGWCRQCGRGGGGGVAGVEVAADRWGSVTTRPGKYCTIA